MKSIIKLARYFETKLAQLQADTDAELARYILTLYSSLGLAERTNALSYMSDEDFKEDRLNLLVYQTINADPNWINQTINHLATNIERIHPGLRKDIKVNYVRALQRPNIPLTYKTLEEISRKPSIKTQENDEELTEEEVKTELGIT